MNAKLSRRVAKIINYLVVNNIISIKDRESFAKRIDLADDFDSLNENDKNIIIDAENKLFGRHDQKQNEIYVVPDEMKLNYNCPDNEKIGRGPGSCSGGKIKYELDKNKKISIIDPSNSQLVIKGTRSPTKKEKSVVSEIIKTIPNELMKWSGDLDIRKTGLEVVVTSPDYESSPNHGWTSHAMINRVYLQQDVFEGKDIEHPYGEGTIKHELIHALVGSKIDSYIPSGGKSILMQENIRMPIHAYDSNHNGGSIDEFYTMVMEHYKGNDQFDDKALSKVEVEKELGKGKWGDYLHSDKWTPEEISKVKNLVLKWTNDKNMLDTFLNKERILHQWEEEDASLQQDASYLNEVSDQMKLNYKCPENSHGEGFGCGGEGKSEPLAKTIEDLDPEEQDAISDYTRGLSNQITSLLVDGNINNYEDPTNANPDDSNEQNIHTLIDTLDTAIEKSIPLTPGIYYHGTDDASKYVEGEEFQYKSFMSISDDLETARQFGDVSGRVFDEDYNAEVLKIIVPDGVKGINVPSEYSGSDFPDMKESILARDTTLVPGKTYIEGNTKITEVTVVPDAKYKSDASYLNDVDEVMKLNYNCPDSEKVGSGPGSCSNGINTDKVTEKSDYTLMKERSAKLGTKTKIFAEYPAIKVDNDFTDAEIKMVTKQLDKVPPEIKSIMNIKGHGLTLHKIDLVESGYGGNYTPGHIQVIPNFSWIMHHEIGHLVDNELWGLSDDGAYTRAMNDDKNYVTPVAKFGPKDYYHSPSEDFAEAISLYINNKDMFKHNFPNRYELINARLENENRRLREKKNASYIILSEDAQKLNTNCKAEEKVGEGPGSCSGGKSTDELKSQEQNLFDSIAPDKYGGFMKSVSMIRDYYIDKSKLWKPSAEYTSNLKHSDTIINSDSKNLEVLAKYVHSSTPINNSLRNKENTEYLEYKNKLNNLIEKSPLQKDMIVYRGITSDALDKYFPKNKNAIYTETGGFASFSGSEDIAKVYSFISSRDIISGSELFPGKSPVIIELHAKKDTPVLLVESYESKHLKDDIPQLHEIILKTDQKYKLLDIKKEKYYTKYVVESVNEPTMKLNYKCPENSHGKGFGCGEEGKEFLKKTSGLESGGFVDNSIAKNVNRINAIGFKTKASCSGMKSDHDKNDTPNAYLSIELPKNVVVREQGVGLDKTQVEESKILNKEYINDLESAIRDAGWEPKLGILEGNVPCVSAYLPSVPNVESNLLAQQDPMVVEAKNNLNRIQKDSSKDVNEFFEAMAKLEEAEEQAYEKQGGKVEWTDDEISKKWEDLENKLSLIGNDNDKQNGNYILDSEVKLNYKCKKGDKDPDTNECADTKEYGSESKTKTNKEKKLVEPKKFSKMSKEEFDNYIKAQREDTFFRSEVLEAISQTEGAKITKDGLKLNVVRYQEPEQAGAMALRGAVFYLPETNSPYGKYYRSSKNEYGGTERLEGKTIYRNPLIIKGATGGNVPERAYAMLEGKEKLKEMQKDVLDAIGIYRFGVRPIDIIKGIGNVIEKYGGDPMYASDIYENTKKGNLRRYAVQEHIIAATVKKAGYDAVIGYTKNKGKMRFSEVLDVRTNENPFQDQWEDAYDEYYDDFYTDMRDKKD